MYCTNENEEIIGSDELLKTLNSFLLISVMQICTSATNMYSHDSFFFLYMYTYFTIISAYTNICAKSYMLYLRNEIYSEILVLEAIILRESKVFGVETKYDSSKSLIKYKMSFSSVDIVAFEKTALTKNE